MFDVSQSGFSLEEAEHEADAARNDPQHPANTTYFHPNLHTTATTACIALSQSSKIRNIWALLDTDMAEKLSKGPRWTVLYANPEDRAKHRYARRNIAEKTVLMHRAVMWEMLHEDATLCARKAQEFGIPLSCEPSLLIELLLGAGVVHHRNQNTLDNRRINLELVSTQANGYQADTHNIWGYPHVRKKDGFQYQGKAFWFEIRKKLKNGTRQSKSKSGFPTALEAGLGACIFLLGHPSWLGLDGYTPTNSHLQDVYHAAIDLIDHGETYLFKGLRYEDLSQPLQHLIKTARRTKRERTLMTILKRPDC